jgi:threonine aldolase
MAQEGVQLAAFGADTVRAVTHLDVSAADVGAALAAARRVLGR